MMILINFRFSITDIQITHLDNVKPAPVPQPVKVIGNGSHLWCLDSNPSAGLLPLLKKVSEEKGSVAILAIKRLATVVLRGECNPGQTLRVANTHVTEVFLQKA